MTHLWSPEQITLLKKQWSTHTTKEILALFVKQCAQQGQVLELTPSAIRSKASQLGLLKPTSLWTPARTELLKKLWPTHTAMQILAVFQEESMKHGQVLRISSEEITQRAKLLSLRKTPVLWTPERTESLRKRWETESAAQIAAILNDDINKEHIANGSTGPRLRPVTRNAVIGKAHRIGLPKKERKPPLAIVSVAVTKPKAVKPSQTTNRKRSEQTVKRKGENQSVTKSVSTKPAQEKINTAVLKTPASSVQPKTVTKDRISNESLMFQNTLNITELSDYECKYPKDGDTGPAERKFCGARVRLRSSYCEVHHRIMYQPTTKMRL